MTNKSNEPEKMDLRSMDISAENRAQLKALFPSLFTETADEKRELVESIDFEKLKAELAAFNEVFESRRERYGMDWPGKKDCMKLIQQPSIGTLKPSREESVNFDETENLFIEGDNLEVLKLLQKSYYGKVKMIYIDPPYNTGNEFIYPDDYSESLDTYLAYAGLVDTEGKKFSTNTPNEGRFHTKWLNMMYPRLYLARNLLREDGVIFISIDDNEMANLRKLCDEIFGEERFIASFIWKSRQNKDNRNITGASIDHEYILCYGKSIRGSDRDVSQYSNPDNDQRGPWTSANMVGLATAERRPNLHYDLIDSQTGINYGCPDMGWRYDRNTMSRFMSEGRILWPSSPQGRPRRKAFFNELSSEFTGFSSFVGANCFTKHGTADIDGLFGYRAMDFPKPVQLLKEILNQGIGSDDIIIDFFSGSCTTAHAVFILNNMDGGNRRFIMVQLPEPCDGSSEAWKAGHKTIADIGKERIRRVIGKMNEEKDNHGDLGFKVFRLDRSSFKIWDGSNIKASEEEIAKQLTMHVDHILPSATQEDILFELLLKSGFMPTEKVEKLAMAGKTVFSIAEGALLICLEDKITRELIDEVAKVEPMQFICLDKGFRGNDQLKANSVQTFAARNQGRDKAEQIVFRTV
jgi:adenine-specific DNA-methyltransferase